MRLRRSIPPLLALLLLTPTLLTGVDAQDVAPLSVAGGAVLLTFDGGLRSHLDAASILEARGLRGTFYVASTQLRQDPWYTGFLSPEEVRDLGIKGHEIGSLGAGGLDLSLLDFGSMSVDLALSRAMLRGITGQSVSHLAYPFGASTPAIEETARSLYLSGRLVTRDPAEVTPSSDPYRLSGVLVTRETSLDAAKAMVDAAKTRQVAMILVFGGIQAKPGPYDWTPAQLTALADHIAASGVPARTASEQLGRGPPVPPGIPSVQAAGQNGRVSLTWTAPPTGGSDVTGYDIYRGREGGILTLVASLGPTQSHVDIGVTNGASYQYRVMARNAIGEGGLSMPALTRPTSTPGPTRGTLILTFDDAEKSHHDASKVLDKEGLKGTFFIPSGRLKEKEFLSEKEALDIAKRGHDIQAHTISHIDLTTLSPRKMERELVESKADLERLLGRAVRHVAYPFGSVNEQVYATAAQHYDTARVFQSVPSAGSLVITDPYRIPSLGIQKATTSLSDAKKIVDMTMAQDTTTILVFHDIGKKTDEWGWKPDDFEDLMKYIAKKNVAVKTYAEYFDGVTRAPVAPAAATAAAEPADDGGSSKPVDRAVSWMRDRFGEWRDRKDRDD